MEAGQAADPKAARQSDFRIRSETVSIPGLNDAKGYKRARFEDAWAAYCPVQIASRADSEISIRRSVATPMESAQLDEFRSVAEASGDGSKNRNLSYSDVRSDASTLRKLGNDVQSNFAATEIPSDDPGPIPEFLRRHPDRRCDHCGGQLGIMNRWDWLGRPDGIWLHLRCEEPWHDSTRNDPVPR